MCSFLSRFWNFAILWSIFKSFAQAAFLLACPAAFNPVRSMPLELSIFFGLFQYVHSTLAFCHTKEFQQLFLVRQKVDVSTYCPILISSVRRKGWRQFFITTIFCNAYFFYPMRIKFIYSYQVTIYVQSFICLFFLFFCFNFNRKTNTDTVGILHNHFLSIKFENLIVPCPCRMDGQFFLLCLYLLTYPGMPTRANQVCILQDFYFIYQFQ